VISVAIIHCPRSVDRRENLRSLLDQLPDASVIEDSGNGDAIGKRLHRRGCWPIARRAWDAFDPRARYHLVLEDDAVLCFGFREHLRGVLDGAPPACISLFHGARDCSVATVMPTSIIPGWISWADSDRYGARHLPHHDYLITQGMRDLGVRHLSTEPSLVDQRALPSLLGHLHTPAIRFDRSPANVSLVAHGMGGN